MTVEARLAALETEVAVLKSQRVEAGNALVALRTDVDGLKRFQAWLFGIGSAVGVLGALLANGIREWVRH